MPITLEQTDAFTAAIDAAYEQLPAAGSFADLRADAYQNFRGLGLPTTQHENWKYTSLKSLAQTAFVLPAPGEKLPAAGVTAGGLRKFAIADLEAAYLVHINGRFIPEFSELSNLGEGVTVCPLTHAIQQHPKLVKQHLGQLLDTKTDAFSALNSAFLTDGLFIHVAKNAKANRPLHLLNVTTSNSTASHCGASAPLMTHPRNLIIVDEGASLSVIEHYVTSGTKPGQSESSSAAPGSSDSVHLTNALTELFVADRAVAHHYVLARESEQSFNISTLKIKQGANSVVHSHTAILGSVLARNNVHPILAGDDAHCLINGLYIGHGHQHLDNDMRVEHAGLRGDSRQFYKGILDDHARGVFTGRIVVHPGAQQTDAKQTNRNLLLSDDAQIQARPQLEIYADDVKCTHGASTGQIDPDMLFYLEARGIDRASARAMMIFAFAAETFERIELKPIVTLLRNELLRRLPGAAAALGETFD
ncbi:MAG: Fe-S cluster assembly protein SufD [Phycisphaeraceae bacterium]